MAYFDLPLNELENYSAPIFPPDDFDIFWERTLNDVRAYSLNPIFDPVDFGIRTLETYDVSFAGYGGQQIKGWLVLPKGITEPLPCVVQYIGYGGGRGYPNDWLEWASAGFAHLIMDTRGQGSVWRHGDTPDNSETGSSPQAPGFMTRGILSPDTYYYRRVYSDAVRAVETASLHSRINADRIAVTGSSQGGGIAIAVAALVPEVRVLMADVPFLCHIDRAVTLVDTDPYAEIATFCRQHRDQVNKVFETLSYFDGVHFAPKITAPALFSTGLMDMVCPPSTVFAAYNALSSEVKEIRVWQFNEHEGGGTHQSLMKIKYLQSMWG